MFNHYAQKKLPKVSEVRINKNFEHSEVPKI